MEEIIRFAKIVFVIAIMSKYTYIYLCMLICAAISNRHHFDKNENQKHKK